MPIAVFSYPRYVPTPFMVQNALGTPIIVYRPVLGPPPITCLGYFHGCPAPALPPCRVPMPILRYVAARCCVTPPFLPIRPWFVTPPLRYVIPRPVIVWRR
jgi:hypothetical protein